MSIHDRSSGGIRRIFWAVPLDKAVRETVSAACRTLKGMAPFRRWTHPEDYHITLIFLGETEEEAIPAIVRAAGEAAARHAPFSLRLGGPGTFGGGGGAGAGAGSGSGLVPGSGAGFGAGLGLGTGSGSGSGSGLGSGPRAGAGRAAPPRVLWFGVEGERDKLAALQRDLSAVHEPFGYRPERRPYTPHITVARQGERPPLHPLPRTLQELLPGSPSGEPRTPSAPGWEVRRIVLYETRMGQSPMYKELAALPLGSG